MKSIYMIIFIVLISTSQIFASDYTIKDVMKSKTLEDGTVRHFIDFSIMDQISDRISIHAKEYPPKFENAKQENEVRSEMKQILNTLDIFFTEDLKDPNYLIRIGYFHSMGHNLDFKGSAQKAMQAFERLLQLDPDNPYGIYLYGMFLSSTAKYQKEAIQLLEKAMNLGNDEAKYTLGLLYLRNGNEEKGINHLKEFAKEYPESSADMIIKTYKEGRLNFHSTK